MNEPILQCVDLKKSYKKGNAVISGLNFTLTSGKIYGLLGPNGCGKSTLIKLICGILTPDSGEIYVCGQPRSDQTAALISYLPDRTYFNTWMKIDELISYFSEFYADFEEHIARRMLADMKIDTTVKLKSLSKGNKEKVQLIMVMARRARLYLLDEPIAGVDPAARDYILKTIIGNYNPDATVVITTHLIHDIEPVLDEFSFMGYGGHIIMSGVADDVRAEQGKSIDELFREVFRCSAGL